MEYPLYWIHVKGRKPLTTRSTSGSRGLRLINLPLLTSTSPSVRWEWQRTTSKVSNGCVIEGESTEQWPFLDPPNTAVFTNVRILDGLSWVHYVTHDAEDGAWQFHSQDARATLQEAAVTSLRRMREIEPRIAELADLPLGWCAWRDDEAASWKRTPKSPG